MNPFYIISSDHNMQFLGILTDFKCQCNPHHVEWFYEHRKRTETGSSKVKVSFKFFKNQNLSKKIDCFGLKFMLKRIIKLHFPTLHDISGWCLGRYTVSGTIYIDKVVVRPIIDGRVINIAKANDLATFTLSCFVFLLIVR